MLRPSMSCVVAMLSGDIELSSVTSKTGYTWITGNLMIQAALWMMVQREHLILATTIHLQAPALRTTQNFTPNTTDPMLNNIIGQGRWRFSCISASTFFFLRLVLKVHIPVLLMDLCNHVHNYKTHNDHCLKWVFLFVFLLFFLDACKDRLES